MTLEEAYGDPVEVWPDNLPVVNTFVAMMTQWRVGMSGPTGLDYGVLPAVMRLIGVPAALRQEVFEGVRAMEDEALTVMHAKKK